VRKVTSKKSIREQIKQLFFIIMWKIHLNQAKHQTIQTTIFQKTNNASKQIKQVSNWNYNKLKPTKSKQIRTEKLRHFVQNRSHPKPKSEHSKICEKR